MCQAVGALMLEHFLTLILVLHNTKTTPRTNVSFRSMLALSARINDWSEHCYPIGPDIQKGTREL